MQNKIEPEGEPAPCSRWQWERAVRKAGVGLTRTAVLLALATHMKNDTGTVTVSKKTIADGIGCNDRVVGDHLNAAADDGWLRRTSRGHNVGHGYGVPNTWQATLPRHVTGPPVAAVQMQGKVANTRSATVVARMSPLQDDDGSGAAGPHPLTSLFLERDHDHDSEAPRRALGDEGQGQPHDGIGLAARRPCRGESASRGCQDELATHPAAEEITDSQISRRVWLTQKDQSRPTIGYRGRAKMIDAVVRAHEQSGWTYAEIRDLLGRSPRTLPTVGAILSAINLHSGTKPRREPEPEPILLICEDHEPRPQFWSATEYVAYHGQEPPPMQVRVTQAITSEDLARRARYLSERFERVKAEWRAEGWRSSRDPE